MIANIVKVTYSKDPNTPEGELWLKTNDARFEYVCLNGKYKGALINSTYVNYAKSAFGLKLKKLNEEDKKLFNEDLFNE